MEQKAAAPLDRQHGKALPCGDLRMAAVRLARVDGKACEPFREELVAR